MRSPRLFLVAGSLAIFSFAVPHLAHAAFSFIPVIPNAYNSCPGAFPLLVVVVNNILQLIITGVIVVIAPIFIAYAGFLYVVSPTNPGNRKKANGVLTNVVVGIIITLAAWLFIDAVLAALTPKGLNGWTALIMNDTGNKCLVQAGSGPQSVGSGLSFVAGSPASSAGGGTAPTPIANINGYYTFGDGSAPCSASQLANTIAPAAGLTLTQSEANTFACIAKPESSCGSNFFNYSWNKLMNINGQMLSSSAVGPWQVAIATNHRCLDNAVCEKSGGTPGVSLRCNTAFQPNGLPIQGITLNRCLAAMTDVKCSLAAAVCVERGSGGFSPWTADPRSQTQQACIVAYH